MIGLSGWKTFSAIYSERKHVSIKLPLSRRQGGGADLAQMEDQAGMSIDLNFWKYENGVYPDHAKVYQDACRGHEKIDGLEALPIEDILNEIAAAFPGWHAHDLTDYESEGKGSFQISISSQTVRFDCYAMEPADMRRFSAVMARFGCPLYDPQLGVRFDKIAAFLIDEAGEYQEHVQRQLSRLLPQLELTTQVVTWDEYVHISNGLSQIIYNAIIHRAKTLTKAVSYMRFGSGWANRPCQCKTALLADRETARGLLEELLQKSIERVVKDFRERTYL